MSALQMQATRSAGLLVALLLAAGSATAAMDGAMTCPTSIKPAARHIKLTASEYDLKLPDGKTVRQMAYNNSAVGPAIELTLGEEVSVDILNSMSVGEHLGWWLWQGALDGGWWGRDERRTANGQRHGRPRPANARPHS